MVFLFNSYGREYADPYLGHGIGPVPGYGVCFTNQMYILVKQFLTLFLYFRRRCIAVVIIDLHPIKQVQSTKEYVFAEDVVYPDQSKMNLSKQKKSPRTTNPLSKQITMSSHSFYHHLVLTSTILFLLLPSHIVTVLYLNLNHRFLNFLSKMFTIQITSNKYFKCLVFKQIFLSFFNLN